MYNADRLLNTLVKAICLLIKFATFVPLRRSFPPAKQLHSANIVDEGETKSHSNRGIYFLEHFNWGHNFQVNFPG